jgi:hypothetical protein
MKNRKGPYIGIKHWKPIKCHSGITHNLKNFCKEKHIGRKIQ